LKTIQRFPISPTRMKAMDCPYYFCQKYVEREEDDDTSAPQYLLMGKLFHEVIEKYNKLLFKNRLNSDSELFEKIFMTVWDENKYIPESKYEEIKDVLTSFVETHVFDFERALAQCASCGGFSVSSHDCADCGGKDIKGGEIELALDWNLLQTQWMAEDVWLRAKLDRVDIYPESSLCVITDYKTGYYIPSETELKHSLQSIIYPFAMKALNQSLERFKVVFHYIRWNKKKEIEFEGNNWFHAVETRLKNFTERITKKVIDPDTEWPPIVGENCAICQFECPLLERGIQPMKTLDQARDTGMQIQALDKKRKELLESLKVWTKATEEMVDIGIGVYGWHPSETLRGLKADRIAEFCLKKGIDLNQLLSVDLKRIKKLEEDDIKNEILSMAKITTSSKFQFKKSEETPDEEE